MGNRSYGQKHNNKNISGWLTLAATMTNPWNPNGLLYKVLYRLGGCLHIVALSSGTYGLQDDHGKGREAWRWHPRGETCHLFSQYILQS